MEGKIQNIIVGSGIAGLICGGYLSKYGQKTLILEKEKRIGGRIRDYYFDGYTAITQGPTWMSTWDGGSWAKAARELDSNIRFFINKEPKIYQKGTHQPPKVLPRSYSASALVDYVEAQFPESLSGDLKEEFKNIFQEVLSIPYKQLCVDMDRIPLKLWLDTKVSNPLVHFFINGLGANLMMMHDIEKAGKLLSAGKILSIIRAWLAGDGVITLPYPNMETGFVKPFAESFKIFGGEIRTENEVIDIICKKNKAIGVVIKVQGRTEKMIYCDRVIVNSLYTDISKLFKKIPPELEEPLRELPEIWTIDHWIFTGLKEKVTDDPAYVMVQDPNTGGHLGGIWPQSLEMPWSAPPRKQLIWYERIFDQEVLKRNREEIYSEMNDVLEEVYPGFKKAVEVQHYATHSPLFHHQFSAMPKIPQEAVSVKNLYFIGDATTPQYGFGIDGTASTGMLCAKNILRI